MPTRSRLASLGVLTVLAAGILACSDLVGGLMGSTVYVDMNEAGGLRAGDTVLLSGLEIGSVSSVSFSEGGDGVQATLSVSGEHLDRLDPATLFMVRDTETNPPIKVLVASNVCTDAPQGVPEGATLKGYAGGMAKVLLLAGLEHPDCAARLVERWVSDLEQSLEQLD